MFKKILTIVVAVLALAAAYYFYIQKTPSFDAAADMVKNPYAASIKPQTGMLRDTLSEDNRQLYDIVKASLDSRSAEIVVKRDIYTTDDLTAVRNAIYYDSPELFWVDFSSLYFRDVSDGFVIIPTYYFLESELAAKQQSFDQACTELVGAAKTTYPDNIYGQILYIHDWLVTSVAYDSSDDSFAHTAYGALVNKAAVCDGYSHAFQHLMNLLDIECFFVEGTATNTLGTAAAHAWNIVAADGNYYNIDTTWDRPNGYSEAQTRGNLLISHIYFLVNDEFFSRTHTAEPLFEIPACPNDYGYFAKLSLEGNTVSDIKDSLKSTIISSIQNDIGYFEFKVNDITLPEDFISDLASDINKTLKSDKSQKQITNLFIFSETDTGRSFLTIALED